MSRVAVLAAALLVASLPAAGQATAPAWPGASCSATWSDVPGDTTYGLVVPVPVQDDGLDARSATVTVTRTHVVAQVSVTKLDAKGPTYGTGHGMSLYFTKYGKALVFSARVDPMYGPRTWATDDSDTARTPVSLTVDPAANAFRLSVARADIDRLSGTTRGGTLTGLGVTTLRSDHLAGANETVLKGPGVGTTADTAAAAESTALSFDACDWSMRTRFVVNATGPGSVIVTLVSRGAPIPHATIAVTVDGRAAKSVRTDHTGRAVVRPGKSHVVRLSYAGVRGGYEPATITIRT